MKRAILMTSFAGILMGCASTQIIDSWKDPSVQGKLDFNQIVVMSLAQDEGTRRITEDEIVRRIGGKAVASHTFINAEDLKDSDKTKAAVDSRRADGIVTVRLLEKSKEINYTPGTYVPAAAPLWGPSYTRGYVYDPGTVTTDTLVRFETNIYAAKDERLLWSGISETFNPGSVKSAIGEVSEAVRRELVKQKMIDDKK